MRSIQSGRRARTWVEFLVAFAVSCIFVALLVPTLTMAVERAWATSCQGHLGELFRAMNLYLHPDQGGNWMPASEAGGPWWFEKLEPFVVGYERGSARAKFACAKAPLHQRGFTRDALSFGWNEHDLPHGTVFNSIMAPREKVVLGDTLGSAAGHAADTLVTRDGHLRLDARHQAKASLLFLDGHVGPHTRPQAEASWPTLTLAPPRPPGESPHALEALPRWQWLFFLACLAVPYALATRARRYLDARRAALAEQLKQQHEQEVHQARVLKETEREAARQRFVRLIPHGPIQPVALPPAILHLGPRGFQLRPDRETTIGRGDDADIRIHNDRMVSRIHAKIRPEPRGYVLYDLCSRSGTFVAREPVVTKVLATGHVIRIGPIAELTFELCEQPATANR